MNEEPKSIWKKSFTGRQWLYAWLLTAAATFLVLLVLVFVLPGRPRNLSDWSTALVVFLVASLVIAALVLCLWTFVRWLCCWRNLIRFIFGVACLATLIALLYAEEDWRGKHAWENFKRDWEAKGEKFDFKEFVPPPVSEDQNFALTPIVYSSYGQILTRDGKEIPPDKRDTNIVNRLHMPLTRDGDDWPTNGGGKWDQATLTDLKPWQDYYRRLAATTNLFPVAPQPQSPAAAVLLALSKYDSTIEELRAASKLPYSRFPIDYDKDEPAAILLPHLAVMKSCIQILELRTIAELQNGQSDKALEDVKLMLYLTQSMRTELALISHLVRIAMFSITLQPIYEGLAQQKWSDSQLVELDSELAKLDFLADYEFSMRGEMVFGLAETEYLRRSRNFQALDYDESGNHSGESFHLGLRLAPASFFYRNELTIAQMHEQWTLPLVDLQNRTVSAKTVRENQAAEEQELQHGWPYNVLARMIFPAVNKAVVKFARVQSSLDLARTAIALERCRLAQGQYPESLDALAPQFIAKVPHDIIGAQPLHYRRTNNGQFVLYSVGWNETDDGGVVVFKKGSSSNVDLDQGDWVWRYPQK